MIGLLHNLQVAICILLAARHNIEGPIFVFDIVDKHFLDIYVTVIHQNKAIILTSLWLQTDTHVCIHLICKLSTNILCSEKRVCTNITTSRRGLNVSLFITAWEAWLYRTTYFIQHCAKKPVTTMLTIPLEMYSFTL